MKKRFLPYITLLFTALLLATSCKTAKPLVEVRERVVHDTTQVLDSIYIDRVHYIRQKSDTVYITDSIYLYKYKYRDKFVEVQVHDSIPYPVEVQVPVPFRTGYDKFCSWFTWIALFLIALFSAWKIYRRIRSPII